MKITSKMLLYLNLIILSFIIIVLSSENVIRFGFVKTENVLNILFILFVRKWIYMLDGNENESLRSKWSVNIQCGFWIYVLKYVEKPSLCIT
jgi:hypothetical protein